MKTTFFILFSFTLTATAQEASGDSSLRKLGLYLADLYNNPFHNIDTSEINYRQEANAMTASDDRQVQFAGYATRALLNMYARKYNLSIADFRKAIALDSTCFICYYKLHWVYFYGKDDYTSAAKLRPLSNRNFEKLVNGDSSNVNNWLKLYDSYTLNENRASRYLISKVNYAAFKIVMLDSSRAYHWWQYSSHTGTDKIKERYALEKAFQLDPTQSIYWNALANNYTESKDTLKLRELFEKVNASSNANHYWYQQKATYLYRLGFKTEAAEIAKEAKGKGFVIVYKY